MNEYTLGTGIIADEANANGWIYPKHLLVKIAKDVNDAAKCSKPIVGQFATPELDFINEPMRLTHQTIHMELVGDPPELIGKIVFIDGMPTGYAAHEIVEAFIQEGGKVRLAPRGFGSVVDGVVQDDFTCTAFDLVFDE